MEETIDELVIRETYTSEQLEELGLEYDKYFGSCVIYKKDDMRVMLEPVGTEGYVVLTKYRDLRGEQVV